MQIYDRKHGPFP